MNENYSKACVEVLEIIKYLDPSLSGKIPPERIDELNRYKDLDYFFEINKNIPLYDNNFMNETIIILKDLLNI